MNVSIVVVMPVYEDRPSASELIRRIAKSFAAPPYIIAIEDGSLNNPLRIEDISDAGLNGEILFLARNMGHQRAIATGILYIARNFDPGVVIVMDSDGEDSPESVPALIEELNSSAFDVVVAQRRKRSEQFSFRAFYTVYRKLFYVLTGRTIQFGNFTALSGYAVRRLATMQEIWVHFAASLMVSRLRVGAVATDRGVRYAGNSQMNFVSLSLHGLRSIMVFAEDVLVRVGAFCALLAVLTLGLLTLTLVLKIVGFATPGWFSTASGILIIILMQSGILMFSTLMISGIFRSGPPLARVEIEQLVRRIEKCTAVSA